MPEFNDDIDEQLRAALGDLGDTAERQVRPPGADTVLPAGRRRRRTLLATGTALALVLVATGWWLASNTGPAHRANRAAAAACAPMDGAVFLPSDPTDALRTQVGGILSRSPEVASYDYWTSQDAYDNFVRMFSDAPDLIAATRPDSLPPSWRFALACSADFAAVKQRFAGVPDVLVSCLCGPPDHPVVPGDTPDDTPTG
jgi:cell division protein FtsX